MKSRTPGFIGIGAQKSGTSWLYKQFEKSSQIDLPPIKELHYFDRSKIYPSPKFNMESKLHKRLFNLKWTFSALRTIKNNYEKRNWYKKWFFSNYTDEWYLSLYQDFIKFSGEITPAYAILKEEDVKKMSELLGKDTKIIFMVRHPVERSWSSFKYKYRRDDSVLSDTEFAKQYFLTDEHKLRCDYLRTITLYKKYFNSIFIGFFEAIIETPECLLKEVFKYLELDVNEVGNFKGLKNRVNKSKPMPIPENIRFFLEKMHKEQIDQLALNYGLYFNKWQSKINYDNETNYEPYIVLK